jgi:hypothetical protein
LSGLAWISTDFIAERAIFFMSFPPILQVLVTSSRENVARVRRRRGRSNVLFSVEIDDVNGFRD